jgi:uncharacterized protein YneF (UPF0154 family)
MMDLKYMLLIILLIAYILFYLRGRYYNRDTFTDYLRKNSNTDENRILKQRYP